MHNGIALDKAREYYDIMQVMYGHKFISQFNGMTDLNRILNIINGALAMLSDEQFQKGMAQLNAKAGSGDFCPTLSDFKTWCMAGSWWTATEAWQRACDYSNQSEPELLAGKLKVTALTKKAWDSVYWLVEHGSMKEAFKQFKSIYETYLAKAQMQGRQQEWYVPPVMIGSKEPVKSVPKTYKSNLTDEQKSIADLTTKIMATGKSWKDAFQEAQMEIRGVVKPMMQGGGV